MPQSLFEKIWQAHEVSPGLIFIDLHLVHEVTSPQAFDGLRLARTWTRSAAATGTLATVDHNVPTDRSTDGRGADPRRARGCRWRRSSATARSSGSRCTRWALSARGSST